MIYRLQDAVLNFSIQIWLNRICKTHFIPGRNFIISKDMLLELGGFHEVLTEDVNLSYRLQKKGKRIGYCSSAVTYETVPVKLKNFWKQQERWYGGVTSEIAKSYGKLYFYDVFFLVPIVISMFTIHMITTFSLSAFLLTGSYFFLASFILGFSIILYSVARNLGKNEILALPLTLALLSTIQVLILFSLLVKRLVNKKIDWYKTPRDNYN